MATAHPISKSERPGVSGKNRRKVVHACTIRRDAATLFQFWRRLENLPRFARHLVSVRETSERESHWVAKSAGGNTVEWDAIIINEHENRLLSWESKAGAEIRNAGTVRFEPAPANQGTEVTVSIDYVPPGGKLGAAIAKLYGEEPELQVEDDLGRFKALMEAGEVPTIEGQPIGPGSQSKRRGA